MPIEGLLHIGAVAVAISIAYLGLDHISPGRQKQLEEQLKERCREAFKLASEKKFGRDEASLVEKGYIARDGKELSVPGHIEKQSYTRLIRYLRSKLLDLGSGESHQIKGWAKIGGKIIVHYRLIWYFVFIKWGAIHRRLIEGVALLCLISFFGITAISVWPEYFAATGWHAALSVDPKLLCFVLYILTIVWIIVAVILQSGLPTAIEKKVTKWMESLISALNEYEAFEAQRIERLIKNTDEKSASGKS
jgi:hypothetical protein